jgi:RNA polymerase sigma-70 factor (ECF subfamily)
MKPFFASCVLMPGASDSSFAELAPSLQLASGGVAPALRGGASIAEGAAPLPGAFEALYRRHFDFVFRSVRRLGIAEAQVDDVVQEVFLIALRRLSDFQPGSNARAWLFSIASRTSANHRRVQRRNLLRSAPLADYPDSAAGPFERVMCSDAARVLQRFLDGLSDDKRDLFILSELEELTGPELAATFDANLNTMYARIRCLRQEFAAYLTACAPPRTR